MAFELSTLAVEDTYNLHLRHPVTDELLYDGDDQDKPVTITLYGTGSKQYRNAVNAMQNRQLKRGKKQPSAEVLREEGAELLVACSAGAQNLSYQGKALDNDAVFRQLYNDPSLIWIREQVDSAIGDVANFLKGQKIA